MAPHSSTLAWKIPWMEEPGGLQSMGWLRVRHDWATSLSLSCIGEGNGNPLQYSCPGESQGRGSLVGCRLWGRTESDTTEATWQQQQQQGSHNTLLMLWLKCFYNKVVYLLHSTVTYFPALSRELIEDRTMFYLSFYSQHLVLVLAHTGIQLMFLNE